MDNAMLIWLKRLYYSMKKEIVQINASFNQVYHPIICAVPVWTYIKFKGEESSLAGIRSAIDSRYILLTSDPREAMKILSAYSN